MHVPAPGRRFARSPSQLASAPVRPGEGSRTILGELGLEHAEIEQPRAGGDVRLDLSDKWRDALADSDVGSWTAVAQGLDDLEDVSQLSGAFARKY